MIEPLTPADLLARIKPEHCVAALRLAATGQPKRYAHNILAELRGVPVRIAKRALRRYQVGQKKA